MCPLSLNLFSAFCIVLSGNSRSEPDSKSVIRRRQQYPSCHRGLRTPRPLRQTSCERSTLALLPHDSLRHAGDGGSEGVWRQEPRRAGPSQRTILSQKQ